MVVSLGLVVERTIAAPMRHLSGIGLAATLAIIPAAAPAQNYPARPIRIIVANTAGSAMDMVTRLIGQHMFAAWGQGVVVDNRPGAGGILGHEIAAKAPPDGYTLLFGASAGVVIQPLLTKVPYDSLRDFTPISLVITSIQMLGSHPSVPANNVEELMAVARAKPGQLNCGSSGSGSSNHLNCEMLKVMQGVDFVHVPFKGTIPSLPGLIGGQVQFSFASISPMGPPVRAGKLRALGQGGAKRSPIIPNIPAIAETYPDFRATTWYALFAPSGTPPAIVNKLNAEVVKTLSDPTVVRRLADQGLDPSPGTPADLLAHMRAETERFGKIVKA